jgi:5-formyltetrahydrofolate cyclo-ligase
MTRQRPRLAGADESVVVIARNDSDAAILLIPGLGDCFVAIAPRNDNLGNDNLGNDNLGNDNLVRAGVTNELDAAKRASREVALASRHGKDPAAAGRALAAHVLRDCPPAPDAIVSGFWPLGEEIDLRPLLHALHERGHAIVLPVTPRRGEALTFRSWQPGDALVAEKFGTMRPIGPVMVPDMLLVPLLAFDAAGRRLGYGGGFYDRTLAGLRGRFRLGCAFAAQQVDEVPSGPYDMRLDAVATENGIIRCGG